MNRWMAMMGMMVCLSVPADAGSSGSKAGSELGENVRLVLTIEAKGEEPVTFSIVSAGNEVKLDDVAGSVGIAGQKLPVLLRFVARIRALDDDEYFVDCTYGTTAPVVTAHIPQKDGVPRSGIEYRNVGTSASLRLKLGEPVEFVRDPNKVVTLTLEKMER